MAQFDRMISFTSDSFRFDYDPISVKLERPSVVGMDFDIGVNRISHRNGLIYSTSTYLGISRPLKPQALAEE